MFFVAYCTVYCTIYCTVYLRVYRILYCTIYCTVYCIAHCTVLCTAYFESDTLCVRHRMAEQISLERKLAKGFSSNNYIRRKYTPKIRKLSIETALDNLPSSDNEF